MLSSLPAVIIRQDILNIISETSLTSSEKIEMALLFSEGDESLKDIEKLGEDIFRFFGLGCRNVSKLFIPQNFDFDFFFKGISEFQILYLPPQIC